ncbi:hypothetical protein F5Y10DRAFT_276961 [Nemania abortiva]|nr:hypothetical protein F5Y10DRAFT_276961 [Nemania abortiva]
MFAGREGRKSFRARARDSFKGLTVDTKMARDSFKAENSSNVFKQSPCGMPVPPVRCENEKNLQSKAESKSQAVDNKLVRDALKAENIDATGDTRVARKASNVDMPRLSEAMLNKNWRNPRRTLEESSSDMMEPLWSAPPEKSKFLDKIRTKPQRDDKHEVVNYDHGLKRVAYRCRRPEEVKPELIPYTCADSVDAELCISAPATKTEFSAAEIETEEQSAKYDLSIFQPSVKTVVRLNDMAPTKRAGYEKILNWDEQQAGLNRSMHRGLRDSSSIATVSLVDSSNWEVVEFPYAEIRAVKGDKKFETGLSGVEETIRNQLSALVVPQSAGLPPEYLRKEYEERREELKKAVALAKSTNQRASSAEVANSPHFNDLLGKLNKLCAPRIRAFTVNDKDDAFVPRHADKTKDAAKDEPRSPSGDSGISGLSSEGRKRSSTLNPEAVEFRCTKKEKPSPVTDESIPVQVSSPTKTPGPTDKAADPIRRLETRVAELEAQLARQGSKKVQFAQTRAFKGNRANHTPHGVGAYSPVVPGGSPQHPAMNNGIQSPALCRAPFAVPPHQATPGFAMGAGGMQPNAILVTGQNILGYPPCGMPTGFANQFNPTPTIPFQGHGAGATPRPATGTSLWVKSMFGPKPVSKPDRPFRPGDGVQAMRQQEYEEYLEHLRATDPAYAQSCKQRQARRADRQRSGQQKVLC